MGLRCLLGHEFGPTELEHERDEDGDEMVVTVSEVAVCERCGERRVLSENTEVTSIRSPDEVGLTDLSGDDSTDATATTAATTAESSSAGNGTGGVAAPMAQAVGDGSGQSTGDGAFTPSENVADDGVILDDGDGRARGEWPDSNTNGAVTDATDADDSPESTPDSGIQSLDAAESPATGDEDAAEDEAAAGSTEADGSEILDAGQDSPGAPDSASGNWPETAGEDEGYSAGSVDDEDGPALSGGGLVPEVETDPVAADEPLERAEKETTGGRTLAATTSVDETEYYCPRCGHNHVAVGSSMRAGDICPKCHRGYIAERER